MILAANIFSISFFPISLYLAKFYKNMGRTGFYDGLESMSEMDSWWTEFSQITTKNAWLFCQKLFQNFVCICLWMPNGDVENLIPI